jgi:SH3 domain-containing YSC84-like protein 1
LATFYSKSLTRGLTKHRPSYSRSKGVFAGIELKGTVISQDTEHMEGVYGKGVTASEVLKEDKVKAPSVVEVFPRTLSSYSARKARE